VFFGGDVLLRFLCDFPFPLAFFLPIFRDSGSLSQSLLLFFPFFLDVSLRDCNCTDLSATLFLDAFPMLPFFPPLFLGARARVCSAFPYVYPFLLLEIEYLFLPDFPAEKAFLAFSSRLSFAWL